MGYVPEATHFDRFMSAIRSFAQGFILKMYTSQKPFCSSGSAILLLGFDLSALPFPAQRSPPKGNFNASMW